jgi:hypothetical protein
VTAKESSDSAASELPTKPSLNSCATPLPKFETFFDDRKQSFLSLAMLDILRGRAYFMIQV